MDHRYVREWLLDRPPATRRFVLFGIWTFLAAIGLTTLQFLIWSAAGWGTANFLPGWLLVVIYAFAICTGVSWFYFVLARSARFEGKIKWGSAAFVGALTACWVAAALAHSLPQLSTLIISSPSEIRLPVFDSRHSAPGSGSRKRYCRNSISFGPLYAFRGGWCGVIASEGETYVFQGQGHAWAARLHSVAR